MHSQLVLFVAFAFIGYTLSAAVESAPKSLDSLNAAPERKNDLLSTVDEPQPEADTSVEDSADLEGSATHYRGYRRAYGYGGYGGYGGYPYGGYGGYGGYGHRRGGYYGGYPSYGYGGYGGYGGYSGYIGYGGYGGYPGYYGGYRHGGYHHGYY